MSSAFVVLSAVLLVVIKRDTTPRHDGRTAAQWFRKYCLFYQDQSSDESEEFLHAKEALHALETNTIAYLVLNEIPREKPYIWRALADLENRWPAFLRRRWFKWEGEWLVRDAAAQNLFHEMRPPGNLVLELLETKSLSEFPKHYYAVWLASFCGEEKEVFLPYFIEALQSGDQMTQSLALVSVIQIRPEMPGLLPHLLNTNFYTSQSIRWLNALESFGPEAAPMVPALKAWFRSAPNPGGKLRLAKTICLIDPDHQEALAFFEKNIAFSQVENYYGQARVFAAIREIGSKARPLVPALLARLELEEAPYLRTQILHALRAGEAEPEDVLTILRQKAPVLPSIPALLQLSEEMLIIDPANPDAIRMLVNVLTHSSKVRNRSRALFLLGQQGGAAESALPLIQKCLADPQLERTARVALNQITMGEAD